MRTILNSYISHYKQKNHSLKKSQHNFSNSLRLLSAVNHNEMLSILKSEILNYEMLTELWEDVI